MRLRSTRARSSGVSNPDQTVGSVPIAGTWTRHTCTSDDASTGGTAEDGHRVSNSPDMTADAASNAGDQANQETRTVSDLRSEI
jgi:hypothetical protein